MLGFGDNGIYHTGGLNLSKTLTTIQAMSHKVSSGEIYLLVGTDYYWGDRISDRIKDKLHKQEDAELIVLYSEEIRSAQLLDYLDSISLFSSAKLILIKNAEQLRKAELEIIAEYVGNPLEDQTLVISAEKIDARVSAWKKIKEAAIYIAVDKPKFAGSIREWLELELKSLGKTMSAKAIEEFISRIELDYSTANNELQKLLLLTGDRKSITENDVIRSLGTTRVGALIDFSRALGKRDLRQALVLAYKMLDSDWEPLQVFFQLQKFYMIIWRIALLKDKHLSASEIMNAHLSDLYPSQKKEYLDFSNAYNLQSIRTIFDTLLDTDHLLKSSNTDNSLLLIRCLTGILSA